MKKNKSRRSNLTDLALKMTDEERAAIDRDILDRHRKLTAEYQFGFYVGKYILRRYLPTLEVDGLLTNVVIKVSDENKQKYEHLENAYCEYAWKPENRDSHKKGESVEWKNYLSFRKELEAKYLPEFLECHMEYLNVTNEEEFKNGLIDCLWNSDVCHYSLSHEDIVIKGDEVFNRRIILKRD